MTLTATRTYSPLRAGCPRSHGTPDDGRGRSRKYHPELLGPDKHLTSTEMSLPCSDETRAQYERVGRRVSQSSGCEQLAVAAHGAGTSGCCVQRRCFSNMRRPWEGR